MAKENGHCVIPGCGRQAGKDSEYCLHCEHQVHLTLFVLKELGLVKRKATRANDK